MAFSNACQAIRYALPHEPHSASSARSLAHRMRDSVSGGSVDVDRDWTSAGGASFTEHSHKTGGAASGINAAVAGRSARRADDSTRWQTVEVHRDRRHAAGLQQ